MSEEKMYATIWCSLAAAAVTIAGAISYWAVETADRDNDAGYTARMVECVKAGGSFVDDDNGHAHCIR